MSVAIRVDWVLLFVLSGIVGVGIPLDASSKPESKPEKILPNQSYYSDELAESTNPGLVRAPGPEKNYEEVYQFYTYYEFMYDERERVILFREYKRGEVIRTEEYRYDSSGSLAIRVVSRPGKQDDITVVEAGGSKPPSKQGSPISP